MRADVGNFPHRLFFFALALLRLTELYNRECAEIFSLS